MTILQYFDFNDKTFLNNSSTKKYLKFKSKIVVKHILNQFKLKFENKTKIKLQKNILQCIGTEERRSQKH